MSLNSSEARLSALARKTFLSMWSYENPFYDQGKELCDVLVVFGDDVIVISDKLNVFGDHWDNEVNWKRWYKKAVAGSIRQLCGARNHIRRAPDKIYTNAQVSSPLPLRLPSTDRMRIHLVAVANGCQDACRDACGHPSLRIDTRVKGSPEAFAIGTLTEDGDFVHIVSTPALDAMFQCFDTARDFIDYLERKKEALLREDWVIDGEENLIANVCRSKFPEASRVFGICLPNRDCKYTSRLYRLINGDDWTDEMQKAADRFERDEKILSGTQLVTFAATR